MSNPVATLFRIPELKDKILFTLFIVFVYRLGAHVVAPGIDVVALREFAGQLQGTVFGIYDMFVGGGLSRATVFALGIMPYISASIMFQLLAAVFPSIERLQKEGEEGRKKLTQYTRYATVVLSAAQAYGYAIFLEGIPGAVANPGFGFKLLMILTLTTGAVFVMWLGEQITERGIGNGMSLLIFFSIIESFPSAIMQTVELVRVGEVSLLALVLLFAVMVVVNGPIAHELGFDRVATGHHARVVHTASGTRIARGADAHKDQSYVLWGVSQQCLSRTIFPLADLRKKEIRPRATR